MKRSKTSLSLVYYFFGILCIFVCSIYFMYKGLDGIFSDSLHAINLLSNPSNTLNTSNLQVITIYNTFHYQINIYYEDGLSGTYLTTLGSEENIHLSASPGQKIFCTHVEKFEPISSIYIRSDMNKYSFHDLLNSNSPNYELHGKKHKEPTLFIDTISKSVKTISKSVKTIQKVIQVASIPANQRFKQQPVTNQIPYISPFRIEDQKVSVDFTQAHEPDYIRNQQTKYNESNVNTNSNIKLNEKYGNGIEYEINVEVRNRIHPDVKELAPYERASHAVTAKFRSLSGKKIDLWFNNGADGIPQAFLSPGQETTTNGYEGHEFYATYAHDKSIEISRFRISHDKALYIINDELNPASQDIIDETNREVQFMEDYYARTGLQWRHYFNGKKGIPRPPPISYMWPANQTGQVHIATSSEGFWHCKTSKAECQSSEITKFELEVISTQPRAFIIKDFLSSFEIDEIVNLAKPGLHKSEVGDSEAGVFESNTRTSTNSWIGRDSSIVIDSLYSRAAHLLRFDEEVMKHNSEHIQVVHYNVGEKYDAHHDWGVSGHPESRFVTLLLYLNDQLDPDAGEIH